MTPAGISNALMRMVATLAAVFTVCGGGTFAQEAARPDRGTALNRNYLVSDIENINLQNGNLQLSIPLASLPPIAGGKLTWTVNAQYNSKIWDVLRYQEDAPDLQWAPYVVDLPAANGGWSIGSQYGIQFRNSNDDFYRAWYSENSGLPQWELDLLNNYQWWKVVLIMPDGAEHELRPIDGGGYYGTQDFLRGYFNVLPSGTEKRYYSVDGSFLFASIKGNLDWTVYQPDGTLIIQTPDGVQRIQDPNGNKIKIFHDGNGAHYQDEQTGREIRVTYDPAPNGGQGQFRVWFPMVGGTTQYIDINMGSTTVQGKAYTVNDWDVGYETGCTRSAGLYSQLHIVRDIIFPQTEPGQQRKFVFSYSSDTTENANDIVNWSCFGGYENYNRSASVGWGELSRVISPPGSTANSAYADYVYGLNSQHSLISSPDDIANNNIAEKKLYHDGIVETWTYGISDVGSSMLAPDGNWLSEWRYCAAHGVPNCSTDKAGLAYRTRVPFKQTERHWINLVFSGADVLGPGGVLSFNPVVDYEYTTLLDAANNPLKMSAKAFQYDYNGNVTQVREYDWFDPALVSRDAQGVPTSIPASATLLRTTNHTYYNQAIGSTSSNVYAKRTIPGGTPLILNAGKETTLGSSIVQLSYDGQAYGVAPTVGNLTSKRVWVNLDSKWITTSNTYGAYGNIATSIDGRGKVTQYFYDDPTHALPNRVVVDPQNGTGIQTKTTAFDYHTGVITSETDVNNQVTNIDYTNQVLGTVDPFARPGVTKHPVVNIGGTNHRRRVTTTYLDSARQVIVATDLNAENDKLLKTRTTTEMLGRTVLTEGTEDGTNYTLSVKHAYLDMGRVTLISSQMRSTASSSDGWTRTTKDAAGRVTEVATFGGATQPVWGGTSGVYTGSVTTAYDTNFTTVTDQAGKVRRSMEDAIGRVRRVDEPDAGGSLGSTASPVQPTTYGYDVFGNLTSVTQGSQTRTFTYDTVSRLRTAANPENGTITYQYDDNGNVIVKTDARGVSAHYEYDSVNRMSRRWYNGSNLVASTTHNSPALPAGVGATDETKFFYDTQALPGGAPSYSRGSAVGRLVAKTYGTGSNGDYVAYDVLGRNTLKIQQTGGINYQMNASLTLSGVISTLTYPSGHTTTNVYDSAGRLTTFSGNLGDGTSRTYSSGMLYAPTGAVVKEQFGTTTPIYNKLFYNSRGQLAEIRESTSYTGPTDTTWDRGAIINHYSNQCWGMCSGSSMSDNNGNLQKQEIYIPGQTMRWQQYDYDSLSRLNWVREVLDGGAEQWKQQFTYDRWGNRTINTGVTYGTGINKKAFTVNSANNRLGVPGGQPGVMTYDNAGNLTLDTYSGYGTATYDAENKITSIQDAFSGWSYYAYDANGSRTRRNVNNQETWLVYGFSGELLAEYPSGGTAANPQKEYGYRNGQLLVTATAIGCGSGYQGTKTWSATSPGIYHATGQQEGTDWAAYVSSHSYHAMVYGPYDTAFGQGHHQAQFLLQVDDTNGSNVIATLDVATGSGANVLAQRQIRRNDFAAANQWQWFTVEFDNPCFGTVEARVWWHDVANMKFRELKITSGSPGTIQWMVTDQLGTPRMIFDQSGSLANTKRHDYLPFGEELFAPVGGRTAAMGYAGGDGVRQQFTGQERDNETGLDYFIARFYSSTQGRFISTDPVFIALRRLLDPQQLNLYVYTKNNPLKFIDPDGRYFVGTDGEKVEVTVKNGKIELGKNATDDQKRIAKLISKSGSKAALEMFQKLGSNDTKIHFKIEKAQVNNGLYGLHQAHDPTGKALNWPKGGDGTAKFEGMANYIQDKSGNFAYKEATITVYEGNIRQGSQPGADPSAEDLMVAVFSHEGDHDTNQSAINAIKDRQEGKPNTLDVEITARALTRQVLDEIQAAKAAPAGKKRGP